MPYRTFSYLAVVGLSILFGFACSDGDSSSSQLPDGDADREFDDTNPDADPSENDSEIEAELAGDGLPNSLPFSYSREDDGQPQSTDELADFTRNLIDFYQSKHYFDWLLRMSHGMDASSGMRDYRLWWRDTHAIKQDNTVSIVHDWSEEHGGHNILKVNSTILASVIGGYLLTGDTVLGTLTEQYCKGISQTMLGMVYDENDPAPHLMARNVITSNHTYTTQDGYEKGIDYSNWYHAYDRWNCARFKYENNPYWGEVWVTSVRSKDGLGYLFDTAAAVLYASLRATDESVLEACGETFDLLKAFTQDIVDSGYQIRTKDDEGQPYIFDKETMYDPERGGDLASFVFWDQVFPNAECNNKLVAEILAYESPRDVVCSDFGGDLTYEKLSIQNNAPNSHIMRAFHISAIKWALVRGFNDLARHSLDGLEERFKRDISLDMSKVNSTVERWERDWYMNKLQAAGAGYPLTSDEVRRIQEYFSRGVDEYSAFANWNLWSDSVPDGEHDWLPSDYDLDEEELRIYRVGVEAMGYLFSYCASPFKNPEGAVPVDCERLVDAFREE